MGNYYVGKILLEKIFMQLFNKYLIIDFEQLLVVNCLVNEVLDGCVLNGIWGMYIFCVLVKFGYFIVWFCEQCDKIICWVGKEVVKKDVGKLFILCNFFDMYLQSVVDELVEWSEDDKLIIEGFDYLFIFYVLSLKVLLDKQISKLEELDKVKDQFLVSIFYELCFLFNFIVGWIDLVLMDVLNVDRMIDVLGVIKCVVFI